VIKFWKVTVKVGGGGMHSTERPSSICDVLHVSDCVAYLFISCGLFQYVQYLLLSFI